MRTPFGVCAILSFSMLAAFGQGSAPATLSPRKPATSETIEPEKTKTEKNVSAAEPIVTEIYADEAIFESTKSIGVFTGHIVVRDPRFNVQGDKLTIYISKKQDEGLEKAIVEGNVGVIKDRPNPAGGPPEHMVGRSDHAVYTVKDGGFVLTGNPRVQQGLNTHVATSPETVMILNNGGQLETHGPSRTEIRQQPSPQPTAKP